MAKITVSREHAIRFPSLASQVGKTVDAKVIQRAQEAKPEVAPVAKAAKVAAPKKAPAKSTKRPSRAKAKAKK